MSSTQQRDLWVGGKQITSEEFARIKDYVNKYAEFRLRAARDARREVLFANDFHALYAAVDALAAASRDLAQISHLAKFTCDWMMPPAPEFNDQFINQFYLMPEYQRAFWLEGAVFCGLGIQPGNRILELCCGMGWYTDYFYSPFASEIVAVDFDPRAIEMAQRFHQRPNIRYDVVDIRESLPSGPFATVIWDAAIEHFPKRKSRTLCKKCALSWHPPRGLLAIHWRSRRTCRSCRRMKPIFKALRTWAVF